MAQIGKRRLDATLEVNARCKVREGVLSNFWKKSELSSAQQQAAVESDNNSNENPGQPICTEADGFT